MYTFVLKSLRSLPNWMIVIFLASCQSLHFPTANPNISATEDLTESTEEVSTISLYQVLSTDTIASIARKYSISPQEIIEINNIRKPYILKPGQLLKLPLTRRIEENSNASSISSEPSQEVRIGPKEQ